jgi:hypothetical protein
VAALNSPFTEKARLAARDRKREANGKCEGRKSYAEAMPDTVALAKELEARGLSYRKIAAELATQGHVTRTCKPHVASAVQKMLGSWAHLPANARASNGNGRRARPTARLAVECGRA